MLRSFLVRLGPIWCGPSRCTLRTLFPGAEVRRQEFLLLPRKPTPGCVDTYQLSLRGLLDCTVILGECLPANPIRRSIAQAGLVFELTCSCIRCRSATDLRQFRQSRDATAPAAIRHYLFLSSVRRSINAVCGIALRRNGLETALHGTGVQTILVFNCDCRHQPLVHLKFLLGMLDEDRRDNAKGGLAGDHQPSYGCCASPRGRALRRGVVHCESA